MHHRFIEDSGVLEGCLETAWSLANDSYQTDLCMRFPPFLIALGCICLAGIVLNKEAQLRSWFASLNIEMKYVRTRTRTRTHARTAGTSLHQSPTLTVAADSIEQQ